MKKDSLRKKKKNHENFKNPNKLLGLSRLTKQREIIIYQPLIAQTQRDGGHWAFNEAQPVSF